MEADPGHVTDLVIDVDEEVDPKKAWITKDPYQWNVSLFNL